MLQRSGFLPGSGDFIRAWLLRRRQPAIPQTPSPFLGHSSDRDLPWTTAPLGELATRLQGGRDPFWRRMGTAPSMNTARPFAHLQNATYLCSINRGVEQLVARRAHNPKVVGSSPAPATQVIPRTAVLGIFLCPLGSTSKRRKTLTWCYYNRRNTTGSSRKRNFKSCSTH